MRNTLTSLITPEETLDWSTWLKRGDQYLNAATSKFGDDVKYNLTAMAFENYAMAIADRFGVLTENHTFTDLVHAIEPLIELPEDIKKRILEYEDVQSICSLEAYHRCVPNPKGVDDLKGAVTRVGEIAHATCC